MSSRSPKSLAHFCAHQWERFDSAAWHTRAQIDGSIVAKAARYLSMTSWYGHDEELAAIAAELFATVDRFGQADRDAGTVGFDLAGFSAKTRYLIALRRVERRASLDEGDD